jgi:iron(III) transport system substrate-binding protein
MRKVTMKHKTFRTPLALGVALVLAVAACGDDDDEATTTEAPTATEAATATPAPAATEAPATSAAPASTEAPASTAGSTEASAGTTGTSAEGTTETTAAGGESAGASEEEWQGIVDAAMQEGKVTVYSVMLPNQNTALEQGFEAAYPGIDMEVIRVLGEMDSKLDAEKQTGAEGADLGAHVNYQWMLNAAAAGDLTEMVGPEARGPNWEGTPWNVDGLYQYSAFQLLGIGCNTNLTETCPTAYKDALVPENDGLIGVVDPGSPVVTDFTVFLKDQLGEDGMAQLRDLHPVFYDTAVPAQQGLAAGEVAVTLYATAQLRDDAAGGAPVEFNVPTPAWSPPVVSYILSWAKHPNAAQLVLDYMATPEGQTAIAINGASALDGIEGTLANIEDVQPVDITHVTAEWAAPYQAEWADFFGR